MTRVSANGYFDADNSKEKRNANRSTLAARRTEDYRSGEYQRAGGVVDPLPEDAPQFVKDYHAYYKTPRGYHARSGNSNDGWNSTSPLPFMNFKFYEYASELENAVLIVHGEDAHSRYFGVDTFKLLHGNNKELLIVADATHCDLYDNLEKIPMNQIVTFFRTWMPEK